MKIFALVLMLSALIQSSILPINLCLILLICRSFVIKESANFLGGFFAGIMVGLLSAQNLGFWPLIFVLAVELTYLFRKLPFSSNLLTIFPLTSVLILLTAFLEKIFLHQTADFKIVIAETLLAAPIYILIKFWEERFIVKNEIKLKIKE